MQVEFIAVNELLDSAFILKNNITSNFNIKALARNKALEKSLTMCLNMNINISYTVRHLLLAILQTTKGGHETRILTYGFL